ncbi:MAG: hypothetical protein ACRCXA_04625 [Peptostreptococcaceae bacterium]
MKIIKETKKSTTYIDEEFDMYEIKISELDGFYHNPHEDNELDEALLLKIKNIVTGRSSTKRCYQYEGEIIENVAYDLRDGNKTRFKSIWDSID